MHYVFKFIPKRSFIIFCVCSALFFLLAADVRYKGLVSKIDPPISQACHDAGTARSLILQCGTDLGAGVVTKFMWAIFVVLIAVKRWHYIPALWFSVDLGLWLNGKMQAFFGRVRPQFPDMEKLTHPGFPSGHTAGAALLFGFLIILAWHELRSRDMKIFATLFASACILFVGWTRIGLLVHHTTDVIGSYLWCTAWLIGAHYCNIAALKWSAANVQQCIVGKQHVTPDLATPVHGA